MLPDQCRVPQSAVPLSIQIDLLFRFETPSTLRPRCQPSDDTIPDFHPTLWVTPMDIYYEMGLVHPKAPASHDSRLYAGTYQDALDAIDQHGCVAVPQGPGLGVEIDWEWVAHNRMSLQTY